jgi:hypothetical protein
MKKSLIAVCFTALWLAALPALADAPAAATAIHFAGGDGSSVDKAVVILGATEATGVRAEYLWLGAHFPEWKLQDQSTLNQGKQIYDVMKFAMPDGSQHTVYFDITDFFGKY